MPARNLVIIILSALVSYVCYQTATKHHYGALLAGAIGEINDHFVRPVDKRELFEGAMDGMVRRLDPYSDYISPKEWMEFQEDLDQTFGGIGIVVEVNQVTGRLTVLSPLPDTPAFAAGIRAGDVILAINGQSTDGFQIMDAVELMRGDPGTSLTVSILHAGDTEPVSMELDRAIIPIASVLGDTRNPDGTWEYTLKDHPRIGYIRLASFGEKTSRELSDTLRSIEPLTDGLILDIRRNGGGLLTSAVEVCDLFVNQGTIVSIRGRVKSEWHDYVATPGETLFPNKPMVVLIDGYSASASEITAACLQDHGRAIVVGQRSWGKGTVQNVMPFEGGRSALKLTVATYWRPSEQNIHRHRDAKEEDAWGVSPNPGYEVKLSDQDFQKVILLRQDRDRVEIEVPEADDLSSELERDKTSVETNEGPSENKLRELPDISGFEDPQLKRAIEAMQEMIDPRQSLKAA